MAGKAITLVIGHLSAAVLILQARDIEWISTLFLQPMLSAIRTAYSNLSAEIKFRLDVLIHSIGSDRHHQLKHLPRADLEGKRALWQRWLHAASSCGLFVGKDGNDLLSRLRGRDDNGFRSALAECMVCWAFSDDLGLRISPRPQGRDGSVLEFLVQAPSQEMNVEVKSPRNLDELANPDGGAVDVSAPAAALARALDKAAKQFNERIANVLVWPFPRPVLLPFLQRSLGSRSFP